MSISMSSGDIEVFFICFRPRLKQGDSQLKQRDVLDHTVLILSQSFAAGK
jgi:hypothetical protein